MCLLDGGQCLTRSRGRETGGAADADEFKGEAQPSITSQVSAAELSSVATDALELDLDGDYAKVMYAEEYAKRPFMEQVSHVLRRQWLVQKRNAGFIGPRIGQVGAATAGAVVG